MKLKFMGWSRHFKVKTIRKLIEHGIYNANIARYIPGMLDLVFQGMIEKIKTIECLADTTYKDKEVLEFDLTLDNDHYTNFKNLHLCVFQWDLENYGTNKSLNPTTTPKET